MDRERSGASKKFEGKELEELLEPNRSDARRKHANQKNIKNRHFMSMF